MKNDEILDSIEYVDAQLISKAENFSSAKKNSPWHKWGAAVACLCLVVLGAMAIPKLTGGSPMPNSGGTDSHYAVYTDRVTLPENPEGVALDMIGCLVYKGSVYTQGASYYGDLSSVEHLVGDYVGEAIGSLDEWSTQDEWATEFASTYLGSVYTVKGYDEDFRLCIYVQLEDGEFLQFLDNFDGIGLNTGKDLFDDRFHIRNNIAEVNYLTHYDWNYVGTNERTYKKLDSITDAQFNEFIELLCTSPFEKISYAENPSFYDTEVQGHLYLELKDGTCVELTLIGGGYVGCAELGWFFVNMPGDIFDAVLNACQ